MSKARQIAILVLGLIVAFCEWGATLIVPQGLLVLTGAVPMKIEYQGAVVDFWVMFVVELLYILFLATMWLWAHTGVFFRLRWVFAPILMLQGIDRFFDALNTPWMIHYICTCFPLRLLGFVASGLAFVLAYLVVGISGPLNAEKR